MTTKEEERAQKLYYGLLDQLPHPWTTFDPFRLDENMKKPLEDNETIDKKFKYDKWVPLEPQFPFNVIHKHLVKLKADSKFKEQHMRSYIFSTTPKNETEQQLKELELDLKSEICFPHEINETQKKSATFLQTLIDLSRECTFEYNSYPDEKTIIKKTRFFLIGKPGIGKTTFINYLISVYDDVLIKNKTIIIRVNLNDAIYKEPNFEEMILSKFLEIYRKYVFDLKIFPIDYHKLRDYIIERRSVKKTEIQELEKIEILLAELREGFKVPEYPFLKDFLYYLTIEHRLSYIYIFDGLDYVTLGEQHTERFKRWLEELDRYFFSKTSLKGSYIITMRDVSFYKAFQFRSGGSNEALLNVKKITIVQCNYEKMLESALERARRDILRQLNNMKSNNPTKYMDYAWMVPEVIQNIITEFLAFISIPILDDPDERLNTVKYYEDLRKNIIEPGLKVLGEISEGNYRCVMRNLRLVLGYFAIIYGKEITNVEKAYKKDLSYRLNYLLGGAYQVLRALIVGRREAEEYRTSYCYIARSGDTHEIEFVKKGMRFVLPPVTNFVYIYKRYEEPKKQFRGLFKIRVLQYLSKQKKPISETSLLWKMNELFGYEIRLCKYDIDEMIYSQLIQQSNPFSMNNEIDSNIIITDLGIFVLNKLIKWYVYFEASLDALPMPESIANLITPLNFYWTTTKNLNYYIVEKARAVMIYLRFLSYVEEKETTIFNKLQQNKNKEDRIRFNKYFNKVTKTIEENIKKSIISTFISRIKKENKKFTNHVLTVNKIKF